MNKTLFEGLLQSIKEAGAIARGEVEPARVTKFEAVDTRAIRGRFGVTQLAFSRMIGVSLATLRNWEQGRRSPHGPARVLLLVAAKHPEVVRRAIQEHRRGVGYWERESNVLVFASPAVQTGSRSTAAESEYAKVEAVALRDIGGGADDRTSASA